MTRPRVVNRYCYELVSWEEVRGIIIDLLKDFHFQNEARTYVVGMQQNAPNVCYQQAVRLATAALLRILKVHPASEDYSIGGTYRQLVDLATVEGVGFPKQEDLCILHRAMRNALIAANGLDEGLGENPFDVIGETTLRPRAKLEVPDEFINAPYRRIRLTLGKGGADDPAAQVGTGGGEGQGDAGLHSGEEPPVAAHDRGGLGEGRPGEPRPGGTRTLPADGGDLDPAVPAGAAAPL